VEKAAVAAILSATIRRRTRCRGTPRLCWRCGDGCDYPAPARRGEL